MYSKYFLNSIYSLNRLLCLSLLDDNDLCEKFICECDRNAAMCFAEAGYNEENADISSDRCQWAEEGIVIWKNKTSVNE